MNIQEYIESGILESYVFGGATDQERQEVECMSKIYPEIKEALTASEFDLERMTSAMRVDPPAAMRASILDAIDGVEQVPAEAPVSEKKEQVKVIPMKPQAEERNAKKGAGMMRLLVAASFIGAIAFAGLFWQQREARLVLNEQVELRNAELAELKDKVERIDSERAVKNAQLAFVQDPATQKVLMPGTDIDKLAKTTAYYNPEQQKVQLAVNKLASLPSEKQYQLWAIVEGVPVDMGVLDISADEQGLIPISVSVAHAQAFAITIEKAGGSPTPSLDQMIVVGNVAV